MGQNIGAECWELGWWVLPLTVLGLFCLKFLAQVAQADISHDWTVPLWKPSGLLLGLGPPFVGPMPTWVLPLLGLWAIQIGAFNLSLNGFHIIVNTHMMQGLWCVWGLCFCHDGHWQVKEPIHFKLGIPTSLNLLYVKSLGPYNSEWSSLGMAEGLQRKTFIQSCNLHADPVL